jgi:hypothetical protein
MFERLLSVMVAAGTRGNGLSSAGTKRKRAADLAALFPSIYEHAHYMQGCLNPS